MKKLDILAIILWIILMAIILWFSRTEQNPAPKVFAGQPSEILPQSNPGIETQKALVELDRRIEVYDQLLGEAKELRGELAGAKYRLWRADPYEQL